MATALPPYPLFDCQSEGVGIRWKKWIARLKNNIFVGYNIDQPQRQKALMLAYGGDELNDIFDAIDSGSLKPASDTEETVFSKAVDALMDYFNPKQNEEYQRYIFRRTKQQKGETMEKYYNRLKQLADTCSFTEQNREIKSQLISGSVNEKITRKGLSEPDLSLDKLVRYGKTLEITDNQSKVIKHDTSANVNQPSECNVNTIQGQGKHGNQFRSKPTTSKYPQSSQSKECFNCGKSWPHDGGQRNCPAYGTACRYCSKLHHFERCCRQRGREPRQERQSANDMSRRKVIQQTCNQQARNPQSQPPRFNTVNRVLHNLDDRDSSASDEDSDYEYIFSMSGENNINKLPYTTVDINGIPVRMIIDTGASIDIIDETAYHKLDPKPQMDRDSTKILAYGSKQQIPQMGKFQAKLSSRQQEYISTIHVVQGKFGSLLSYDTATKLGLIKILSPVNMVNTENIYEQYPTLFSDKVGLLKDFTVKLHIDREVQPVAQQHRRIPFHIRRKVEEKLNELEENDIIEKVEGPTPWVSPIVTIPKPGKPEEIRICVDMRLPNTAIKRERHITPTIEDVLSDLNGACKFSRLDLRCGYHQCLLDEESRYITTFSTHLGLRRYKRLNFGINCAAEIFQNAIRETLEGIDGVINASDDILVYGRSDAEHDHRLHTVLQRLESKGLTARKDKCIFGCSSLKYLGYIFSANGISPDPAKVTAIKEAAEPQSASEVRSLLGLANYCQRFIPDFATITAPLRKLTQKDVTWSWQTQQQKSFEELKTALTAETTMDYFNPQLDTEVIVDASPVGLAAILTQHSGDNVNIISYASRALTPTEQRYSQTEREALAVVFGCEKFHLYVYGQHFSVITDHQALVRIFGNPRSCPSARLERLTIRLQPYDITVTFKPGRDNPADFCSRHPLATTKTSRAEKLVEEYIHFIVNHNTPVAISTEDIQAATLKDEELQNVAEAINTEQWHKLVNPSTTADSPYRTYYMLRDELCTSVNRDMILRGHRIILPTALRNQAIDLAHEGHQGLVKSKQLLRAKIWFPNVDQLMKDRIGGCMPCQASVPQTQHVPLQMSVTPQRPWQEISADFYGPIPSGEYLLVLIDGHSRFPCVETIHSTSANSVIPALDKLFSLLGIPEIVKTDNGPPFSSQAFSEFAKNFGFQHRRITPVWPQANAEAERFMQNLGKVMKTASIEQISWKQQLQRFLRNYRATPHSSTGIAPSMALFNREIPVKLPNTTDVVKPSKVTTDLLLKDAKAKATMKSYADQRRHARPHTFKPGDVVIVKQPKVNKTTAPFDHHPYIVDSVKGSMVTAKRNDRTITRNASHFKHVHTDPAGISCEEEEEDMEDFDNEQDIVPRLRVDNPEVLVNRPDAPVNPPGPRRSHRQSRQPAHLSDYVVN